MTKPAEDYLLSLQDRTLSERTIRNHAIVLKAALKFAHKQGYLASERLYSWKIPRVGRASVYQNPLSRFRNAPARTFCARRDQAIVAVQVSTGLRISETLSQKTRQEDMRQNQAKQN